MLKLVFFSYRAIIGLKVDGEFFFFFFWGGGDTMKMKTKRTRRKEYFFYSGQSFEARCIFDGKKLKGIYKTIQRGQTPIHST
jgi:hypothetical protein